MRISRILDRAIEVPVVTSFTRLGFDARSRLPGWQRLVSLRMDGKVVVVTGATSGLGLEAARQFVELGATVVVLGRDAAKTEAVRARLAGSEGADVQTVIADMGDLAQVRRAAGDLSVRFRRIDVLVHNAGALTATRQESPQGIEQTVASQVVGPHLLTTLLLPRLRAAAPGRVITVSSGGMYASPLRVEHLQMDRRYNGTEQYARAKRAQVTLNEMWAQRVPATEVVFHAMHPGWADTPGVEHSLPTFRRVVGPLLRSTMQGADTIVWLAAASEPGESSGGFWLDRARRSIHKMPRTRRSDTALRRQALWSDVEGLSAAGT